MNETTDDSSSLALDGVDPDNQVSEADSAPGGADHNSISRGR